MTPVTCARALSPTAGGPVDLLLVRHGQSEANAAKAASRRGDDSLYSDAYRARPSAQQRLTDRGRADAAAAGALLRTVLAGPVHAYVSPFTRALETAAHLGLDLTWTTESALREQDWGAFDALTHGERHADHTLTLARVAAGELSVRPPGGESLHEVADRISALLDRWIRLHDGHTVLAVTHEKVLWTLRLGLDRLPSPQWEQRFAARKRTAFPHSDAIVNGAVVQYTRRDPASDALGEALSWRRISLRDENGRLGWGKWESLPHDGLTESDLRAAAEQYPPLQ